MDSYGFEAEFTASRLIGVVPAGLRLDIDFSGTVNDGALSGGRIDGTDYLLVRHDGTSVIDVRETITGPGGEVVAVRATGYSPAEGPPPPLEAVTDPEMVWPDVDSPLHGAADLQTATPHLRHVNSTVFAWRGTANLATGRLVVRARAVTALLPLEASVPAARAAQGAT